MNTQPPPSSQSHRQKWKFPNISTGDGIACASVVIALALSVSQCTSTNHAASLQMKQNMVGYAISILKQRPPVDEHGFTVPFPDGEMPMRKWAVGIINSNSEIKIEPKAAKTLMDGGASGFDSFARYERDEKNRVTTIYTYTPSDGSTGWWQIEWDAQKGGKATSFRPGFRSTGNAISRPEEKE
jgi:hypothetical protein